MYVGRLMPVTGDADCLGQALLLGSDCRLQRAALLGAAVEVVEVADGVQLDQVDLISLQPLEGPV